MENQILSYQDIIIQYSIDVYDNRLEMASNKKLNIQYAPFEHINAHAKLVIAGITPGAQQANCSLKTFKKSIQNGLPIKTALKTAKETASFSGPMRKNLIMMLNFIGIGGLFEIEDCSKLFGERSDLVHYTSVLRNPVFRNGKNYSGSPQILKTDLLFQHVKDYFFNECKILNNAIYLPLGREVESVLKYAVENDILSDKQVLFGLPHPSGANAERIAYFLERKSKKALSSKTSPEKIDANKKAILKKMKEQLP